MDTLIIENFRCFRGRHEAPIRPLTLLVGENSTGKTTFLAGVKAALSLQSAQLPDFNEPPFQLGSFDQIAHDSGRDLGRVSNFTIGNSFSGLSTEAVVHSQDDPVREESETESFNLEAKFISVDGQPSIDELTISSITHSVRFDDLAGDKPIIKIKGQNGLSYSDSISDTLADVFSFREQDLLFILRYILLRKLQETEDLDIPEPEQERINSLIMSIDPLLPLRPYSFAPIRTQPRRTYEPTTEIRMPEGDHIPLTLKRLHSKKSKHWPSLERFGKQSGLYEGLSIHNWGDEGSDPFQVQLNLHGGSARNLIDVGYGVSQVLPIITDSVLVGHREFGNGSRRVIVPILLIQQPEVHLHPRAQAELGSFFIELISHRHQGFVIETHSDYLMDRIRLDIRDGKIESDKVVILYFEQGDRGASIHPIEIDNMGNLLHAPPSYRRFFLEEEHRFFRI